jgi:hypothetical protein
MSSLIFPQPNPNRGRISNADILYSTDPVDHHLPHIDYHESPPKWNHDRNTLETMNCER